MLLFKVRLIEILLEITNVRDGFDTFYTTREYKLGGNRLLVLAKHWRH